MKDKIETYLAATMAAAMVLSPTIIVARIIGYFIELICLL